MVEELLFEDLNFKYDLLSDSILNVEDFFFLFDFFSSELLIDQTTTFDFLYNLIYIIPEQISVASVLDFFDRAGQVYLFNITSSISIWQEVIRTGYSEEYLSLLEFRDTIKCRLFSYLYDELLDYVFNDNINEYRRLIGIITDFVDLEALLGIHVFRPVEIISLIMLFEIFGGYGIYNQNIVERYRFQEMLDIKALSGVISRSIEFFERLDCVYSFSLFDTVVFEQMIKIFIKVLPFIDILNVDEGLRLSSLGRFKDLMSVSDKVIGLKVILQYLLSVLEYDDFADFIREVIVCALYLYFNFYMPERFSIVEVPVQNRSDTIFCLGDGLYELDYGEVVSDTVVALNLAQLGSSRVKRLDKIYYDTQPKQVRVYVDGEMYNFDGEENYVTLPKGLRGKDWKVVLDGMKNVEYIDLGLVFEKRGKS